MLRATCDRTSSTTSRMPANANGSWLSAASRNAWAAAGSPKPRRTTTGATRSGLPAELPVMGALVESGLQNLPPGDADSAGFFQMRVSIWNKGDYAGYPENPDLQVKWFVDQSLAANQRRVGAGLPPYGD